MSRALPLARAGDASPTALPAIDESPSPALRGTVAVFDPAMCCPTGLCGPGVDPALLAISRDLRWLEKQGATVVRTGLSTDPQAFVAEVRVQGLMQAFGDGALPATLVNGHVVAHGRYPSREELVAALSTQAVQPAPGRTPLVMMPEADGSCCEPGGGCC